MVATWRPEPIEAMPARTWSFEGSLTDTLKSQWATSEASPYATTSHLSFTSRNIELGEPKVCDLHMCCVVIDWSSVA